MKQGERRNNPCGSQTRSRSSQGTSNLQSINEEKIDGRPQQPNESTSKGESNFAKAPWDKGVSRAEKLNAMTPEDRIHGLYDLHCVSDILSETPQHMATKLDELDVYLKKSSGTIVGETNSDTENSAFLDVKNEGLEDYMSEVRLRFLRAERFDAEKAAARIERYLEVKRNLFESICLGRDLIPDDLSEDDWMHVRTGYIQILSDRDKKGRAVVLILGRLSMTISVETTVSK